MKKVLKYVVFIATIKTFCKFEKHILQFNDKSFLITFLNIITTKVGLSKMVVEHNKQS